MSENTVREPYVSENPENTGTENTENTEPLEAQEAGTIEREATPPTAARRPGPRGPSASTVVCGLMFAVVAALLLGHELDLFEVDPVTSRSMIWWQAMSVRYPSKCRPAK